MEQKEIKAVIMSLNKYSLTFVFIKEIHEENHKKMLMKNKVIYSISYKIF